MKKNITKPTLRYILQRAAAPVIIKRLIES